MRSTMETCFKVLQLKFDRKVVQQDYRADTKYQPFHRL